MLLLLGVCIDTLLSRKEKRSSGAGETALQLTPHIKPVLWVLIPRTCMAGGENHLLRIVP